MHQRLYTLPCVPGSPWGTRQGFSVTSVISDHAMKQGNYFQHSSVVSGYLN